MAIRLLGGSVKYDWQFSNGNYNPGGKRWAPPWLVDLAGHNFFGQVAGRIQLVGLTPYSDTWMANLEVLTKLKKLTLNGTQVTDAGMVHLKGLTSLSELDLSDTDVTDAGLAHLTGLTTLSTLNLHDTRVSDMQNSHSSRA